MQMDARSNVINTLHHIFSRKRHMLAKHKKLNCALGNPPSSGQQNVQFTQLINLVYFEQLIIYSAKRLLII